MCNQKGVYLTVGPVTGSKGLLSKKCLLEIKKTGIAISNLLKVIRRVDALTLSAWQINSDLSDKPYRCNIFTISERIDTIIPE